MDHVYTCGSRTELCNICLDYIVKRGKYFYEKSLIFSSDYENHVLTCTGKSPVKNNIPESK